LKIQNTREAGSRREESKALSYVYFVCAVAALGGLLFGFYTAVIAGAVTFLERNFSLTPLHLGVAVSSISFGCMVGAGIAGFMGDWVGPKRILIASAFPFILSAMLCALAWNVVQFTVGRFVGGLAIGLSSPVSPVYIAEISPARMRGRLVTLNQLAITLGMLLAFVTDWGISLIGAQGWKDAYSWRWMFASGALPALLFLMGLMCVPESPRWLAKRGLLEEAEAVLARLFGRRPEREEFQEFKSTPVREEGSGWQLLLPPLRRPLIIGVVLMIFSQVSGLNVIVNYTPKLLLELGFESESTALLGMVITGMALFLTTVIAMCVIDKIGRRVLLLFSAAGLTCCLVPLAIQSDIRVLPQLIMLLIILCAIIFYALGIGPVSWLVVSEIFPTHVRGRAAAICTVSLWATNFVALLVFPSLHQVSPAGTFWLFVGTTVAGGIFVWHAVPETKDKTLEAIEQLWRR
jgi:sugar porter (SP) family MFS transporter